MVGRIERGMMAGTKLVNERKSYYTPGLAKPMIDAANTALEAQKRYEDREKQLVFKRLNLEAQNLQAEQMEKIRTANSVDEIMPMVEDFEKRVKENMEGQKWGKEWMSEMSSGFYTANHNDVASAFRNKEKELAGIELNKTVGAYADNIALSGAERAQELMSEAEGLIDSDVYLTPSEKQKSKENLTKVAISNMVNHNPAQAIKQLNDAHQFRNLGEVDRKEYKEKAEKMLRAQQADNYARQQKVANEQAKNAENNITLTAIDLMMGNIDQAEALRRINEVAPYNPKAAQKELEKILSGKPAVVKDSKPTDDNDVKQMYENRILAGEDVTRDLILSEANGELTTSTVNNLLKRQKQLGNSEQKENPDEEALRKYITKVDELGQAGINQLYADGEISNEVRTDLIKELDNNAKRKVKTEEQEQQEINDDLQSVSDMLAELKNSSDATTAENQKSNYLDVIEKIDNAKAATELPTIGEINDLVRDGGLDDKQGKELRTARNKKEGAIVKAAKPAKRKAAAARKAAAPVKLSADDKAINLANYQDEYIRIKANPEATSADYADLLREVQNAMNGQELPAAKAQELINDIYIPLSEKLKGEIDGQGVDHWFGADEGFYAMMQYVDQNLAFSDKAEKAKTVAERNAAKEENARKAKQRARLFQLYRDNLAAVAADYDIHDINQIPASMHKSDIWNKAWNQAKAQYLGTKYPNLSINQMSQTTKIMSRDGVEMVNGGAEDTGKGKPLVDTRIVQAGPGKSGKFYAKFSDGTKKRITKEEYDAFMGVK